MTANRFLALALPFALVALTGGQAQEKKDDKKPEKKEEKTFPAPAIPPTAANVPYGPLERQVLDFWQAKSDQPTPLVFCIHGGGWSGGDKSSYYGVVKTFLDNGISVVTINYRLMAQANRSEEHTSELQSLRHLV